MRLEDFLANSKAKEKSKKSEGMLAVCTFLLDYLLDFFLNILIKTNTDTDFKDTHVTVLDEQVKTVEETLSEENKRLKALVLNYEVSQLF